ncbi:MAG: flagellar protein FlaG [Sulfurimonas sp.]|uniref:flagellar protein FlaG n=1 Tax=Sulfurimonas sp. TaxID=2022749 RepID=UPI0025F0F4E2|nr:flagellar protein FlaG [Sulfurimonas sp.]MCK9454807.1 flagellar protein FlaG [Sulfurimonas sp.]
MDGITNVAKQQQSQISQQESQGVVTTQTHQVEQPKQVNVVKEIQEENSSKKIDSKEQVQDLVDQLNKALAPMTTNVKFGVDMQDIFYVSVIEAETSKMIRRFPAEEAIGFLPKMKEVSGILFDSKG